MSKPKNDNGQKLSKRELALSIYDFAMNSGLLDFMGKINTINPIENKSPKSFKIENRYIIRGKNGK